MSLSRNGKILETKTYAILGYDLSHCYPYLQAFSTLAYGRENIDYKMSKKYSFLYMQANEGEKATAESQ